MINIRFENLEDIRKFQTCKRIEQDVVQTLEKRKKDKYAFKNYKPNKNCVPVTYNGKEYKSKAQCIALEGITRKELEAYLKEQE